MIATRRCQVSRRQLSCVPAAWRPATSAGTRYDRARAEIAARTTHHQETTVKNSVRNGPKLALRKEQLRILDPIELAHVGGGDPASALCPTHRFCTLTTTK
jgi:hypothetical protein